jgi:hypothetical protein
MKMILAAFAVLSFAFSAIADDRACIGTNGTPNTAKFFFDPIEKDVDTEGEEVPYRIKLTYKNKTLLNKVVTAYLFEGTIYFDGDQQEEAWVNFHNPEESGLKVPGKNLDLRFNCEPLIGRPFAVHP